MDDKNKVKQDGYKVNIDSKYTPWVKLGSVNSSEPTYQAQEP
jgi:hypothetical protein